MANIKVSELHPAGSELFMDSESFLNDLTDMDTLSVQGGQGANFVPYIGFGSKLLEYGVVGYAINNLVSLAQTFSTTGGVGGGTGGGTGGGVGGGTGGAGGGTGGITGSISF
ncbi:MAG: hypothetical protein ACM37W_16725 [Actinomycetota bacterium]